MKKLLALIVALALLLSSASADADLSVYSDSELKELISACSAELLSRATISPDWILIFEYGSIHVYQIGEPKIFMGYLDIPVALCNDNDYPVIVTVKDAKCNGWEIYSNGCSTSTGKAKKKDKLTFKVCDADISSIDQIVSLSFSFGVINREDTTDNYYQGAPEEYRFW